MGRITIADRTYLNGTLIGTEGNFLPQEFTAWNTTRLYEIPESIVNYDSDNELVIEVWVNGEASIVSSPYIGLHEDVKKTYSNIHFWNSQINSLIAFFMLIIAIYHLIIWIQHRSDKENLYFAVINLVSAAYMSVFFLPKLPSGFTRHMDFLVFQKIFSIGIVFLLPFTITTFVNAFFGQKDKKIVLAVRCLLIVIPVVAIILASDYVALRKMRNWTQLF